ncbi:tetratricopeptide repeat protein [Pseudomonas viridiflava]|uniref:tetratricopeptide repeat protein n=2 Tax=Pseudomonas viridiflava TaxID=33069 RepID=UPI000F023367|nr:tetratricopeptide repeat protein [Pseudomonas viridiflava]
MRVVFSFLILLAAGHLNAATKCEADLSGDGVCDSYTITRTEDGASSNITINIGATDKTVSGEFDLGDGGLSVGYFPAEFSLLLDFHTRGTDLTKYVFKWSAANKDWVLYKRATWVEPSIDERYSLYGEKFPKEKLFPQGFHIERIACCTYFSAFSEVNPEIKVLSADDAAVEVSKELDLVFSKLPQGEKGELFYTLGNEGNKIKKNIPQDFIYETSMVVNERNVGKINDYAYYLYLNKNNIMAALILKEIRKRYPDRVVATLNLADVYWSLGMKEAACPLYKDYMDKMKVAGKESRIPTAIRFRTSCT